MRIFNHLKQFLQRLKNLPPSLWLNPHIGSSTYIDSRYVLISGREAIFIGNDCKIMAGLRLEAVTNYGGITFNPQIHIGDNVCINQNFHCTCATRIIIGSGTSITANCGVFDIIHPYEDIKINPREQLIESKPISIGKNCLIGMNSVILPGVVLGDHVIVGANSTIREGIYPSNVVLVGSPAKIVRQYDYEQGKWVNK